MVTRPKPTFQPRLEELEGREVPTATPLDPSSDSVTSITSSAKVVTLQVTDTQQNAITAQQNREGDTVSLQAAGIDANNATLTYSASALPAGLSIDPATGAITGTIAAGAATGSPAGDGSYPATISATDGTNTATTALAWTVTPRISVQVLDAAQSAVSAPQNIEGDTVALQASATTPDNTTLTYSATNLPTGLSISPTTGAISGTIAPGAATGIDGIYTMTIDATDGTYTGSATPTWNVSPRISLSVVDAQQNAVTEPQNIEGDTVALQALATTPDNTTLTYSATNLPTGLTIDPTTGAIAGTIAPGAATNGDNGSYSTIVSATDGTYSTSQTILWTISPRIALQMVDAQQNAVTAPQNLEGDTVNLQALATTPDSTTLTYRASNLPAGLTINSTTGAITGSIAPGAATSGDDGIDGNYTTTITVTDGTYSTTTTLAWTESSRISLTLVNGQDNLITAPFNVEGDTVALQAVAATPDNSTLTYSATNLPAGLAISGSTGAITGTILPGAAAGGDTGDGNYATIISVTDGVYTSSVTLNWSISTVVLVDSQQNIVLEPSNVEGDTVNLQVQLKIASQGTATYSALNLPTGLTIDPSSGAITGTIAVGAASNANVVDGIYWTTITVTTATATATTTLAWGVEAAVAFQAIQAEVNAAPAPDFNNMSIDNLLKYARDGHLAVANMSTFLAYMERACNFIDSEDVTKPRAIGLAIVTNSGSLADKFVAELAAQNQVSGPGFIAGGGAGGVVSTAIKNQIDADIIALGDNKLKVRNVASKELLNLMPFAETAVIQAKASADLEVSKRATDILKKFDPTPIQSARKTATALLDLMARERTSPNEAFVQPGWAQFLFDYSIFRLKTAITNAGN